MFKVDYVNAFYCIYKMSIFKENGTKKLKTILYFIKLYTYKGKIQKKFILQDFLLQEEKENCTPNNSNDSEAPKIDGVINPNFIYDYDDNKQNSNHEQKNTTQLNSFSLNISNASAKWRTNQTNNSINRINLTIKPCQLVAIVGAVGAGKV